MNRRLLWALVGLLAAMSSAAGEDDAGEAPTKIVLVDVTEAAGLAGVRGDRISFGDYDGDGDADVLLDGRQLLRNDTEQSAKPEAAIRFADVSKTSGIRAGPGGGACWVDLDGDGDLDVVTPGGALKIQVEPGRFENRAKAWGLPDGTKGSTVGVGDFNGDGRPDLLFGGGEDWNEGNAIFFGRRLFRNVDGGKLEDVTAMHELGGKRYGRAVVWADYDADGDQDAYMGNYRLQPNELLVNEDGVLRDRAKRAGVAGVNDPKMFFDEKTDRRWGYQWGHTIASSWADLDADGDLDLWVSNLVHKYVGPSTIKGMEYDIRGYVCDDSGFFRNDGAPGWGFTNMRPTSGVALRPIGDRSKYVGDELWSNAACGDLDGDGLPEVFVAQVYQLAYSHSLLFHNQGNFRFEEISKDVDVRRFNSYGGAFADLDGDGDLDLVCSGAPQPKAKRNVCVYRNDTVPGPWIAFRVATPLHALGTQVLLETDQGRQVAQVESCMGSHAQQNEHVLRFGLRGRKLEGAFVRWPGNVIETLGAPKTGIVHVLTRPEDVPRIEAEIPVDCKPGEMTRIDLKAIGGKGRLSWKWSVDRTGDGNFERLKGRRLDVIFQSPRSEVRVRLTHKRRKLARERVLRFEAPTPAAEKKDD